MIAFGSRLILFFRFIRQSVDEEVRIVSVAHAVVVRHVDLKRPKTGRKRTIFQKYEK